MAGVSKGLSKPDWHGGAWRFRFSYDGKRHAIATGETDKGAARKKAEKVYAETIAGLRSVTTEKRLGYPTGDAVTKWIGAIEAHVDEKTLAEYERVALKWPARWPVVQQIDNKAVAEYTRGWLASVVRETARKYRLYLQMFLRWCKEEEKIIPIVPDFPELGANVIGTRAVAENPPTILTPAQAEKLIRALPAWSERTSRRDHGEQYAIRDYYRMAWETAWRPATLDKLACPLHFKRGASVVNVTPDIVKDRNRSRRCKYKTYEASVSPGALEALERCAKTGRLIFGQHRAGRARVLAETAQKVLKLYVTDYDFKHSRMTQLTNEPGADLQSISLMTGVSIETILKHYVHAQQATAKKYAAKL